MNNITVALLWIYVIISQFVGIYFWYLYSQTHGFLNTLFIGFFVSEFKALLWPFFI
jgi:hypothetical protein